MSNAGPVWIYGHSGFDLTSNLQLNIMYASIRPKASITARKYLLATFGIHKIAQTNYNPAMIFQFTKVSSAIHKQRWAVTGSLQSIDVVWHSSGPNNLL